MATDRKNNMLMAAINAFIIISTVIIVIIGVTSGAGRGQVGEDMSGNGYFKAFTNLSNILGALCSAVMLVFNIRSVREDKTILPRWAVLSYFAGASALGLTFIIVVGFLGPLFEIRGYGYFVMFSNDMFFFHFFNPVLCGISFMFMQNRYSFGIKENLVAVIPTLLYSFVYAYEVVVAKSWSDFYNFTFGGHFKLAPLIMLAMYVISFLIALALRKVHNRSVAKSENS